MKDDFIRYGFQKVFNIEKIITMFYMELPKDFHHEIEQHDFWEMVYIDKGEMICTSDTDRFTLKSGELTFHKPSEYHNLSGNHQIAPNISILTFQCRSNALKDFEKKIFRLNAEEKSLLSSLYAEGLGCFQLINPNNPLLHNNMKLITPQPFGGTQMVKNLLEIFLIKLYRSQDTLPKSSRQNYVINGTDVPYPVKEILDFLQDNLYNKITISDIAVSLGKGESTVKKLFSLYKKDGITKYYNSLKIKEARRLIREGSYNMTQIADLLCFDTPQYFSKCFKQYTKMTPSEYKSSIMK